MQKINIFFITAAMILTLCIQQLHSQEINNHEIKTIEITGLTRTKPHIARYPLEVFLGRDGSALDLNEVEAVIRGTGVLEPKEIELVEYEDGMILHIIVEEKWSIFPFPMFMAVSGERIMGLYLVDTNFLGILDQAAIGGMYGTAGWSIMAFYNHTPNKRGVPGWNSFFSYNRSSIEDTDRYSTVHRRYSSDQLRFSFGLQYALTHYLSAGASVSYTNVTLNDISNAVAPPDKGAMLIGFSPNISLRSGSWDGVFLSQQSVSLTYSYNHAVSGSPYHQAGIRAVYEQSIVRGLRLCIRSGLSWNTTSSPLFEDSPSSANVDILPRGFAALKYAGLSAGLEKHLFTMRWGTLSISGSWQAVISEGSISDFAFDHGPYGAVRFYLSRVALPAMGLGMAYNMNTRKTQFGFSIGMSL